MASDFEKPDKYIRFSPGDPGEDMAPAGAGALYGGKVQYGNLEETGDLHHRDCKNGSGDPGAALKKSWPETVGICQWLGEDRVESEPAEAKGIGNSITLPRDAVTDEEAKEVLKELAASVAGRLKKAGQKAGMLSVEIKYHTFESVSHQRQLAKATNRRKMFIQRQ